MAVLEAELFVSHLSEILSSVSWPFGYLSLSLASAGLNHRPLSSGFLLSLGSPLIVSLMVPLLIPLGNQDYLYNISETPDPLNRYSVFKTGSRMVLKHLH